MTRTSGVDFKYIDMKEREFLNIYIPALKKALENKNSIDGNNIPSPDWYIENEILRKETDLYIEKNINKYNNLFDSVGIYFDAISHGFETIDNLTLKEVKQNILNEVKKLESYPDGASMSK